MNYNGEKMEINIVSKTIEELYNLSVFVKIKDNFKEEGINFEDLDLVLGYHYNTFPQLENGEVEAQYTRYTQFHNSENTAQLVFSVTETLKGKKEYTLISNLKKEENQDGNIVVIQSILKDKDILNKELIFDPENYGKLFEDPYVEEDENFSPFEYPIRVQFPFDFCAPGIPHYEHCGPGCGIYSDYGGGTPINATDRCCKGHDVCWHNFGHNDPCCDAELLRCIEGHTTVTADVARSWFKSNADKC